MAVQSLPLDILSLALDNLGFWDVLNTAHVCRSCRAVALNHATYWRRIGLHSASPTSIDCFRTRLVSGGRRPVALDIDLVGVANGDHARIVSDVLPLIRGNLYRLESASIRAPRELAIPIISRLDRQAPRLQYLALSVTLKSRDAAVRLPPTLFNGQCPQLRSLILSDVTLPDTWMPALDRVDHIQYHHLSHRIVTFPIASILKSATNPPLRSLELLADDFALSRELWSSDVQAAFRRLQSITISCGNSSIVSDLPLHVIPDVVLSPPELWAAGHVMTHVGAGDLSLHVEPKTRCIADTSVVYASANSDVSDVRRIFWERLVDLLGSSPHRDPIHLYFKATYADRITNLTASSSRWCIFMEHSLAFRKCSSLTVVLDDIAALQKGPCPAAARGPSFPALTSLVLTLGDTASPPEGWRDLVLWVEGSLASCRLILRKISVDMFDDAWLQRFKAVE